MSGWFRWKRNHSNKDSTVLHEYDAKEQQLLEGVLVYDDFDCCMDDDDNERGV